MIQLYKDRYGNQHIFDTENETCGIPGCDCKVATITKRNLKYSKMYCESHTNDVLVACYVCGKQMKVSCSDFMRIYPKQLRCKQCQLNELNKTDHMRKQAGELGKRLHLEGKGMFSEESKRLANINSHSHDVCKARECTKEEMAFMDLMVGMNKGLS